MAPHGTGYIPDTYDPRDLAYTPDEDVRLQPSVDLFSTRNSWLTPIYDQGQVGRCVANAVAATIRYLGCQLKDDKEEFTDAAMDPSRLFIYYNARALPNMRHPHDADPDWSDAVSDTGSRIRDALKTLKTWENVYTVAGVLDRPPTAAYEQAHKTRVLSYYRLDSFHEKVEGIEVTEGQKIEYGSALLANVKHCLSEGHPVIFGFTFYEGIRTEDIEWDEDTKTPGDFPRLPTDERKVDGRHAVLIVGFDDMRSSVLVQNSWGPDEQASLFWMNYEWISDWDASEDFWTLRYLEGSTQPLQSKACWTFTPIPNGENAALGGSSTIATVSRKSSTLEIMWIDQHGSVLGAFYYGSPDQNDVGSHEKWTAFAKPLGKARNGSGIVAVSCGPPRMQVFWIGTDGFVKSKKSYEGQYDWVDDDIPSVSGQKAKLGVTALSRMPGHIEVWWTTESGEINGSYRYDLPDGTEGSWTSYQLPTSDIASYNGNIVSVSRHSGHQELWWANSDGKIRNRYFEADWKTLEKDPVPFAIGNSIAGSSRLTATVRDNDNEALFYVTPSGKVRGAFWRKNSQPKWKEDLIVGSEDDESGSRHSIARVDSDIKVVSIDKGQYDVIWVGPDCSLRVATVYPETEKTNGKRPMRTHTIHGSGIVSGGSPLGAFKFQGYRAFGVLFVDKDGALTLGYCPNPV